MAKETKNTINLTFGNSSFEVPDNYGINHLTADQVAAAASRYMNILRQRRFAAKKRQLLIRKAVEAGLDRELRYEDLTP